MSSYNTQNRQLQGGSTWEVDGTLDIAGSLNVTGTQTNASFNFDADNEDSPSSIGELRWNGSDKTIDMKVSDTVTIQLSQEQLIPRCVNKSGADIPNGSIVYVDTAQGNRPTIKLADADTYATSYKTIGLTTENIVDNAEGFVTINGLVRGLNTSALNEGDCLYLSTTAGEWTDTEPADGKMRIFIGMVTKSHTTDGHICVKIQREKYMFGDVDAGNYSYFESDGTLRFIGNATVWKDLNIGGVTLTRRASNQPDIVTIDSTNIVSYGFDGAGSGTEEAHGSFELQHDYKTNTDLVPHAHIYPTTADAGNIKFFLDYWVKINGVSAVTGTTSFVQAAGGTAWEEIRVNFDDVIDGSTIVIGSQIHFRIYRDAGDEQDTYGADAVLGTLGIHYEIDTIGSRQITTK